MKDQKWTELMLQSLKQDPSLASYEEWNKAGDYAAQIRFFPHAFNCYRNAFNLDKNEEIANKLNVILDKVTNVLELVPDRLKPFADEIRFNNPLDPEKWLEISNKILKEAKSNSDLLAAKFALTFTIYTSLRSHGEVHDLNVLLEKLTPPLSDSQKPLGKLSLECSEDKPLRAVALGDNVTLGLQAGWEVKFQETYHFLWAKESNKKIYLANCGVSGAGMLDAALYLGRDVVNYKPDLVFINFGINDAWLGHKALIAYEAMLDCVIELLAPKFNLVLITPIPHIPENCPDYLRPTQIALNEVQIEPWVEACKRAASRANIPLADAYAEFPKEKSQREKYFANKFNQPNLAGQKLIFQAINKVVRL